MNSSLQYIVNNKGKQISVVVPIKNWEKLNNNYKRIENKLRILSGIKSSLIEIHEAKKNKIELQTLNEFLNECND